MDKDDLIKINDYLKKAKTQLQLRNSFFGRLILGLDFEVCDDIDTMGIDYKGKIYYNPQFVKDVGDNNIQDLIGLLAHELYHLALLHHFRFAGKEKQLSNIAQDICINAMLVNHNYTLPSLKVKRDDGSVEEVKGLIPNGYDEIEINFGVCKVKIVECSKKNAETIYEELIKQFKNKLKDKTISLSSEGFENEGLNEGIKEVAKRVMDKHLKIEKNKMTKKEYEEAKRSLEGKIREALTYSKMRGDTPSGLDRLWGELHEEKFNWKILLQRYITELLPFDQSWRNFGKKTYGTGVYTPMTLREQIDVSVAIDLSGSIGKKELTEFISEIVGVAKQFKNRIKMKIITHESEVGEEFNVFNEDDIKGIRVKGGGGTSFQPMVDYIKDNHKDTKCLIWLTDGFGEKDIGKQPFEVIWVLTEDGNDELCKSGKVLWLKDTINNEI